MKRKPKGYPPHPADCQECIDGTHLFPDAPTSEQIMAGTDDDEPWAVARG